MFDCGPTASSSPATSKGETSIGTRKGIDLNKSKMPYMCSMKCIFMVYVLQHSSI